MENSPMRGKEVWDVKRLLEVRKRVRNAVADKQMNYIWRHKNTFEAKGGENGKIDCNKTSAEKMQNHADNEVKCQ